MEFSQICIDIIGYCAVFLIWFPFLAGILFFIGFAIFVTIQEEHLKKDYFKSLSEEDRKVVMDYLDNTNYFRVKRKKRRLTKLFNENINKDK